MDLLSLIRLGASRLGAAKVEIAHHHDNAIDEARELMLFALNLPHDFPATLAHSELSEDDCERALAVLQERIDRRVPAAYLTGTAWFAGHAFKTDTRALVPRSPIAELISDGFSSWFGGGSPARILDLCAGSGCIGIAAALRFPNAEVVLADISPEALSLARENIALHRCGARVHIQQSDLFASVSGQFDLILSNPPYVTDGEYLAMAQEYRHEPKLGLTSGSDGLDHPLQILRHAAKHLQPDGLLVLEVGESERALKRLLPTMPARWIEFSVGQMGIMAISRPGLEQIAPELQTICQRRFGA